MTRQQLKRKIGKPHPVPLSGMHPTYRAGYALGSTMLEMLNLIGNPSIVTGSMDRKTFVTGFESGCLAAQHAPEKRPRVKRKRKGKA